ncbi:MAG: hypothetical protein H0T79_22510 [Deltaproteobacteria bacterium]|nr:hypothetical protein [Deltaproteobacteria bacterium]
MARRLGWLGPAIVAVGLAAGGVGGWYMMTARPSAGEVIDTLPIDSQASLVVRAEQGGDRTFIELHVGDETKWQALVPTYAGRRGVPGLAWTQNAVSVRVVRGGRAEIFAVAMRDGSKLGGLKLAPDHGPIKRDAGGPVTFTDHVRSYEIVAGEGWNQLVALDLAKGRALWKVELGPAPVVEGGLDGGVFWVRQGTGRRSFYVFNGEERDLLKSRE